MNRDRNRLVGGGSLVAAGAIVLSLCLSGGAARGAQAPKVTPPQPTVPQVFTLMGQYVRVAYNNVGFATLGYRIAQESVGQEWMLLEVGLTVRAGTKNLTFKRDNLSIKTPDGSTIRLATQKEFAQAGYLMALNKRAKVQRDPINYFPGEANRACAIRFFSTPGQLSYDEVELSPDRGCLGRLFFQVPGGIKVGQHWLIVKFGDSEVQVPFRILTKDEQKELGKTWEDIKKAWEEESGQ
jgi:hypothetical protein